MHPSLNEPTIPAAWLPSGLVAACHLLYCYRGGHTCPTQVLTRAHNFPSPLRFALPFDSHLPMPAMPHTHHTTTSHHHMFECADANWLPCRAASHHSPAPTTHSDFSASPCQMPGCNGPACNATATACSAARVYTRRAQRTSVPSQLNSGVQASCSEAAMASVREFASLPAALPYQPPLAALQEPVPEGCKAPRCDGLANLRKEAQVVVRVVHLQQHLRRRRCV